MFQRLGALVARYWLCVTLLWLAVAVDLQQLAPSWDSVTHDGNLAYMPSAMPSVQGAAVRAKAFPDTRGESHFVLVFERPGGDISGADYQAGLKVAEHFRHLNDPDLPICALAAGAEGAEVVNDVLSPDQPLVGKKLLSADGRAFLVILRLTNDFMAVGNIRALDKVEATIDRFRRNGIIPPDLNVGITGSAAIGGDTLRAAAESISNTETYTVVLILLILLVVYRAPGLAAVPLASIAVSVLVAMHLVALMTQVSALDFMIFKTTKIFIVVILFGAGTDYCLFLIARYKEELINTQTGLSDAIRCLNDSVKEPAIAVAAKQADPEAAGSESDAATHIDSATLRRCADVAGWERTSSLAKALANVGDALVASALTTVVGLGMMYFADFGKFRNSGPAIGLCLLVALLACTTLAPALLRGLGRGVFWPFRVESKRDATSAGQGRRSNRLWEAVAARIVARPGLILTASVLLLLPFAYQGMSVNHSFDLLADLPRDRPSVLGTDLLKRHYHGGEIGPLTVIAHLPEGDFNNAVSRRGSERIHDLTLSLYEIDGVRRVRSRVAPLGDPPTIGGGSVWTRSGLAALGAAATREARENYVSQVPGMAGEYTRFDVISEFDPFSPSAIDLANRIQVELRQMADQPDSNWHGATFYFAGTTPGIRDLEQLIESDEALIQKLVVVAVLAVLLVVIRRPLVCGYLIVSVVFSYLVTLGATQLFFEWLAGQYGLPYHGIDWKVSVFLFVILVAIGQDYNIYLVTRVIEEQQLRGPIAGLKEAVVRTGGIITSCGLIMVGTFLSMTTGTLVAIRQLGFALALGVMLDTFVVRPILVPCFLVLMCRIQHWYKLKVRLPTPSPAGVRVDVPATPAPAIRDAQKRASASGS